jgi:hypothetical protein
MREAILFLFTLIFRPQKATRSAKKRFSQLKELLGPIGGGFTGLINQNLSSEARRAYDISKNLPPQPVLITDKSLNGLLILNEATKDTQFYRYHNDYFTPYNITFIEISVKMLKLIFQME